MSPSDVVSEFLMVALSTEDGERAAIYEDLLTQLPTISPPTTIGDDLNAIAHAISYQTGLGAVAIRSILSRFVAVLFGVEDPAVKVDAGIHALDALASQPQQVSLADIETTLRELVATAMESLNNFRDAAEHLAQIPLDGSQRRVTDEERARIWVRITRDYLEDGDAAAAEAYVNKLKGVMHAIKNPDLALHFRLSQARVQDAHRQFLPASQRYHEISMSTIVAEEERLHTLAMAIKCAVLAHAGPLRSRALARLYRDDRAAGLPDEFAILEKMFLERLLSAQEVAKFSGRLEPHQLAKRADGSTVLDRAVVEHNLLAVSRLYNNISFESLAERLGLDPARAEAITARMIQQGRLVGSIDQVEGRIWFGGGEASGQKGSGRVEALVGKEIRQWDANIEGLSLDVENITSALQAEFPAFVAARLAV